MIGLVTKQYLDYLKMQGYPTDDITAKVIEESENDSSLKRILANKKKYQDKKKKRIIIQKER